MKILVTGAGGLLGRNLVRVLQSHHEVIACPRAELDIADETEVHRVLPAHRPDYVVNCAAMTGVDACELDPASAHRHNAEGPRILARQCREIGAFLMHVGTDYVFDGTKPAAYTPDDEPNPISVYGRTKLEGETHVRDILAEHCIVRVAGVHGAGGRNFASQLRTLLEKEGTIRAVADNRMLTGYAPDLVERLRALIEGRHSGTFHAVNSGPPGSWHDMAVEAARLLGSRVRAELVPVKEVELNRPARRPMNSTLACPRSERLGLPPLRDWREALAEHVRH